LGRHHNARSYHTAGNSLLSRSFYLRSVSHKHLPYPKTLQRSALQHFPLLQMAESFSLGLKQIIRQHFLLHKGSNQFLPVQVTLLTADSLFEENL